MTASEMGAVFSCNADQVHSRISLSRPVHMSTLLWSFSTTEPCSPSPISPYPELNPSSKFEVIGTMFRIAAVFVAILLLIIFVSVYVETPAISFVGNN